MLLVRSEKVPIHSFSHSSRAKVTSSLDHWVHWVVDSVCTQGPSTCNTTQISIISGGNAIYGCMDSTALNYNPLATCDSACTYYMGCMDPSRYKKGGLC